MKTNETIQCILERQSCRKYLTDRIDPEIVEAIVTAGTYAPNAGGEQPWTITALTNPEKLAVIGKMIEDDVVAHVPGYVPGKVIENHGTHGHILCGEDFAPMLAIVSEAPGQQTPVVAAALACENMIIAAQSFGIASCWMGAIAAKLVQPAVDDPNGDPLLKSFAPEGNKVVGVLAFGYPAPDGYRTPRLARRPGSVVRID